MPGPTHIESPLFAKAARKYGLSEEQVTTLVGYFCAQTPFVEVQAATHLNMEIINWVYSCSWRHAITGAQRAPALRGSKASGHQTAIVTAPVASCTPSAAMINMTRQLLALRIDRETVRLYLRADMPTWRSILKSMGETSPEPDPEAANLKA